MPDTREMVERLESFAQDLADVMRKHGIKKILPSCNSFANCHIGDSNRSRIALNDNGGLDLIGMHIVTCSDDEGREGE